jgi:hypothetical protein
LPKSQTKLTDIPASMDLSDLLYRNDIYNEITSNITGLNIITRGLQGSNTVNRYGFNFRFEVNNTAIQNYRNNQATITAVENYLQLGGKKLVDVMNAGNPGEPLLNIPATPAHADYLELPDSLKNLVH